MLFNSLKSTKISILILDFNLNNLLKIDYILNIYIHYTNNIRELIKIRANKEYINSKF